MLLRQRKEKKDATAKKLVEADAKEERKRKAEELKLRKAAASLDVQLEGASNSSSSAATTIGKKVSCANPICKSRYIKPKNSRQGGPDWVKCLHCKLEFCNLCHAIETDHAVICDT